MQDRRGADGGGEGGGYELTKDEAEAYMAELADVELDGEQLKNAAGGGCYCDCGEDRCPQEKCIY